MKKLNLLLLSVTLLTAMLLSACKSDDEKNINDILPGMWVLDTSVHSSGYTIDPDDGTEIMVDHLEMTSDHKFKLVYDEYDSDSGTYEAGNAYIRFDYSGESADLEPLLWQILSFTDNSMNATYSDSKRGLKVTVWLKKR